MTETGPSPELALQRPIQPRSVSRRASDARLIRRAKAGSPDAIEELIRRHWPQAHRAALLIVQDLGGAEDIAQEALLAVVRSLDRFDWRRPLAPWLHRIVVNGSLDHIRTRRRRGESHLEIEELEAGRPVEIATDQTSGALATAISALEPTDRAIVVLRHVLDYRSPEIGRMLAMPAATVRTRLRRALDQLKREVTS